MKFFKTKIRRCKNCKYYRKLGQLHYCINSRVYRKYGFEAIKHIPLLCFRKEVKDEKEI